MRFATDATLGKLGRHLRTAGFDTICRHENRNSDFFKALEPDRIILTRTAKLQARYKRRPLLFIRENDPHDQMAQIFRELEIGPDDLRPFSRCTICNLAIRPVDRQTVRGKVPAYIWQHHRHFRICPGCRRIYWSGSHHQRLTRQLEQLFNHKESRIHE